MRRWTAAQTEMARALDEGRLLTDAEQLALLRRHWAERAPVLPPDCPRPALRCGEPHDYCHHL